MEQKKKLVLFKVLFFCLFLSSPSYVFGAEVKIIQTPAKATIIMLVGTIRAGDSSLFLHRINGINHGIVFLSSPGGLVSEALAIGKEIRSRGLSTSVIDECVSACGLIWLSGNRLYLNRGTKLGFHAAYRKDGNRPSESGVANAEIGSYLTQLGYKIDLIKFVTIAKPNEVRWFDRNDARRLNVSVEPSADTDMEGYIPLYQKSDPINYRQEILSQIAFFASHLAVIKLCEAHQKIDFEQAIVKHKSLMKEAEEYDNGIFYNILGEQLKQRADEIRRDGLERFCENEKKMFRSAKILNVFRE